MSIDRPKLPEDYSEPLERAKGHKVELEFYQRIIQPVRLDLERSTVELDGLMQASKNTGKSLPKTKFLKLREHIDSCKRQIAKYEERIINSSGQEANALLEHGMQSIILENLDADEEPKN